MSETLVVSETLTLESIAAALANLRVPPEPLPVRGRTEEYPVLVALPAAGMAALGLSDGDVVLISDPGSPFRTWAQVFTDTYLPAGVARP